MVTLEQVEKLHQYKDISYDEARRALEEANGDILEAIIILERQNIIQEPKNGGYYSSKNEEQNQSDKFQEESYKNGSKEYDGASFTELVTKFFKWAGKIIKRGNINHFEVVKGENKIITIPSTILALLLLFMFKITIPLLVIGLFFGYRYMFTGPDLGKDNVNNAMGSVADAAEKFKKEIKDDKPNGEDSNN